MYSTFHSFTHGSVQSANESTASKMLILNNENVQTEQ